MDVRKLSPNDAMEVARLWQAGALDSANADPCFVPRLGIPEYAQRIEQQLTSGKLIGWGLPSSDGAGLVAYLTAKIEAPSEVWSQDGHLYVCDVDVQADQRERGHLRRLLACAQAHARAAGLNRIELGWIAGDARAEAAWTRLGFRPFIQVGYLDLSDS